MGGFFARRPTLGPAVAGLGVVAALLAGAAAYSDTTRTESPWLGKRLGQAPPVGDSGGAYAFMATQPGSDDPVGYSPCRPIYYEVNPEHAPIDHQAYLDAAIGRISAATGLVFEHAGTTDSRDFDRTAVTRAPVLVAWATEAEVPALAGDVAGVAGSTWREEDGRHREYITGQVVLDADTFSSPSHARRSLQAVVDHEFGHLVGLAHVDEPTELMYDEASFLSEFGPGDLEGFARLGNIECR